MERERWHIGLKAWLWPFWLSRRRVGSPQLEAQENQAETLLTRLITALPEGEAKLKAALEDVKGVITTQQKARAKAEARAEKLRGLMLQFLDRHAQASSWRPRRFNRLIISIAAALGCTMALNVYFILTVSEPWIAAQAVWRAASERVASGVWPFLRQSRHIRSCRCPLLSLPFTLLLSMSLRLETHLCELPNILTRARMILQLSIRVCVVFPLMPC